MDCSYWFRQMKTFQSGRARISFLKLLMNVLIIDDDPEDTSLFCEALNELYPNATCTVAHSSEYILTSIDRIIEMDIIFIDGHMHPMDGQTCLELLIKSVDRSKTKIVIYSGSLSPKEQLDLKQIGADYILLKAPSYYLLKASIGEIFAAHFRK